MLFVGGIVSMLLIENADRISHSAFRLFEVAFMMVLILLLLCLNKWGSITVPVPVEVGFVAFSFCSLILGDVADFYARFEWWDLILHGISGILLGLLGYMILIRISPSPVFLAAGIICFSLALGSLWEIMEYVTDGVFGLNSQQFLESSGTFDSTIPLQGRMALRDTMQDMIMNLIGALTVAAGSFLFKKHEFRHEHTIHRK